MNKFPEVNLYNATNGGGVLKESELTEFIKAYLLECGIDVSDKTCPYMPALKVDDLWCRIKKD